MATRPPHAAAHHHTRSPYTASLVEKAFGAMPTDFSFSSLVAAFGRHGDGSHTSAETVTRHGGVRSTLFLIGIDGSQLHTASAMSAAESNTAAGRAAWRRQRRLAFYLWHAVRHEKGPRKKPLLMLADLDDISDGVVTDGTRTLPKLSSSTGACGRKIAVPILLKGFGSTDFERWLATSRASSNLSKQPETPPWSERISAGVWRGSSRSVLPEETCRAVPDFTKWEDHPRGKLVALSGRYPHLIDAGYSELEKMPGGNSTPVPLKSGIKWNNLRNWKYQIEVDGHGYQASLLSKMLLGSAVLTQRSHFNLWFQDDETGPLVDGVHVVRVRKDLRDLPEKIMWLRTNDSRARAIAARGAELVHALLKPEHLLRHMAAMLSRYSTLFVDSPPPLSPLFGSLCGSGKRTCNVYNLTSPPPRFARLAEHREASSRHDATSNQRVSTRCPTMHFADAHSLRCDGWCRQSSAREHCTWCKCGACEWCGAGKPGDNQILLPRGFVVARAMGELRS